LGKKELTGYQASARGGLVKVRLGGERVYIGGRAVTVVRGKLLSGK
jgi:predicted PhzF superfamily epimerase YddE/YHI9